MDQQELNTELPENYEELKRNANRTSDWRARLSAVEELGEWKHQKVIDVLTHRLVNDPVYTVQEAAYKKLKELGQDVKPPSTNKPELVKGVDKILLRLKKSLPANHTYEDFKVKLKNTRSDVYDIYEGSKGDSFESWLESKWTSLTIR